jgi:hypothetical protein
LCSSHDIDQGKQDDPYQVNHVPAAGTGFHAVVVCGRVTTGADLKGAETLPPSRESAWPRIEQLRIELANSSVHYHDDTITVTLSAAIAGFPEHGDTVESLIARADQMLYRLYRPRQARHWPVKKTFRTSPFASQKITVSASSSPGSLATTTRS